MMRDIQNFLASNRAEEIGRDVWEQFVISPSYRKLGIGHSQKPKVVVGGRGCGKTMLLRYLAHESAFSQKRIDYPPDAIRHIGVYWKADTQFASMLEKRGQDEDTWRGAFDHLAAVVLCLEVLRSLESISKSHLGVLTPDRLSVLDFSRIGLPTGERTRNYQALLNYLEDRLAEFENWANDVRTLPQPKFIPGNRFIKRLIGSLQQQLPEMKDSVFAVYIDEYENLNPYQQKMINTWLKHSEPPLIFNLAMKRNGFKTRQTEGGESLSDIHDYRKVDLEDFGTNENFGVFAAEILLSKLLLSGTDILQTDLDLLRTLRDPNGLAVRRRYKKEILEAANSLFPSPSQSDLARNVFADSNLADRLKLRVKNALESRGELSRPVDEFILKDFPEASIVIPALISRRRMPLVTLVKELDLLVSDRPNRFTGSTNWVHNNFVGCYLQLFDGLVRPCPLFSGFQTFANLAGGNLRHFLELCYQAIARSANSRTVAPEVQAAAAQHVAADFLGEVRSFGVHGNNLHAFLLRLGSLFSLSQQSPTQSEPERTHFSIREGVSALDEKRTRLLAEAVKWSVISEHKGTKRKDGNVPENLEYVIDPIYSPYFHISYRKRRKLDLAVEDVATLVDGTYSDVRNLLGKYRTRWAVNMEDAPLPLFAHMEEGNGE